MEIILVRHGETQSNRRGTFLGWTDVDLNEEGIRQAHCVQQKLSNNKVDVIFTSPLKRASHTAEIINKDLNVEIIYSDALKERNFGIWDNLTCDEIREQFPQEYNYWMSDINYPIKDGEMPEKVNKRIIDFINKLIEENSDRVFVIVTHLGCIRIMLAHLLCLKPEDSWRFRVDNGSISRVQINQEKYAFLTLLNG